MLFGRGMIEGGERDGDEISWAGFVRNGSKHRPNAPSFEPKLR